MLQCPDPGMGSLPVPGLNQTKEMKKLKRRLKNIRKAEKAKARDLWFGTHT